MRGRDVIEFLGLWESLHNPNFKPLEFEVFKSEAGANAFTMSPKKWIDATNAIGIVNKIVEVAGTVGYNDSNYFSKTFRKAFGISPSEYREQHESGGEL